MSRCVGLALVALGCTLLVAPMAAALDDAAADRLALGRHAHRRVELDDLRGRLGVFAFDLSPERRACTACPSRTDA